MIDLAQLEPFLNTRLLGQREAVAEFCSAVIQAERGPARPGRPKGFVLLLGPTGTGKTEMVNLTARFLFGAAADAHLERFDMGEYQHPDSVKRLLGSPDQPPLLGAAIARLNARGGGFLLLDEIEKAFPDLLTTLLSFDSARSTMFDGTTHSLAALIVVLTSNLGAAEAARMQNSGYSAICRKLRHAAEERFKKEGVARFTAVCCTNVLTYGVQEHITRDLLARELRLQSEHLRRRLEADPSVLGFLIGKGFSPDLGARNIRNCVERHLGEALRPYALAASYGTLPARLPPSLRHRIDDRWTDSLCLEVAGDALVARPLGRSERLQAALARIGAGEPDSPQRGGDPVATPSASGSPSASPLDSLCTH